MTLKIQIIIAIVLVSALFIVFDMIRKNTLDLKYALSWIFVGVGVLILDIFPGLMGALAKLMGIEAPVNMLFFLGFCFSLIIIFTMTVALSRMSLKVKKLTQEMALMEKYFKAIKDNN